MGRGTDIVAGLDLGSSKVSVVITEVAESGERNLIGVSLVPIDGGVRAGQVVAIERTTGAIRTAVEDAAKMAGCQIHTVRLGIGGCQTVGFNSNGMVAVRSERVTEQDLIRAVENARALPLPGDKQVLHTLPQEFIIDGHDGIRTPVGMNGIRLECRVHVITAGRTALVNALECCTKADLTVDRIMFNGLAASASVLTEEERELGVVLCDVGAGTTDVTVWYNNALVHTIALEWGGLELTRQIARGLRTPSEAAERVKQRFGCALASMVADGETMDVPSVGGREAQVRQRHLLCEILEPGLEDLFGRIAHEIDVAGCREYLAAGLVLTGGTANLSAIADLGEEVLVGMPVRVGVPAPKGVGGLTEVVQDPRYAAAVGLCLDTYEVSSEPVRAKRPSTRSGWFGGVRRLVETWF
jgi:cell division protein FtsA